MEVDVDSRGAQMTALTAMAKLAEVYADAAKPFGDVAFESEYRVDTPVLEHGTSIEHGGITCVSEPEGVTCENAESGHGFTISASRNDLW